MRLLFLLCFSISLFSCNSSGKKEQSIDDSNKKKYLDVNKNLNDPSMVPVSTLMGGKLNKAWQWTDATGENLLVTSFVEPYDDKGKNEYGEEGQTAELHAALYLKKDTGYQVVWRLDDKKKSCPFDITCEFIKDAITITDLDSNGIAEATIQYRLACRSDVSPSEMKLVMYEGQKKYSLKGLSWLKSSPEDSLTVTEKDVNLETLPGYNKTDNEFMKTFGRYESEKGFASAPPEFLLYARQQWMKFVRERSE